MNLVMSGVISFCSLIIVFSVIDVLSSHTKNADAIKKIIMLITLILLIKIASDFDLTSFTIKSDDYTTQTESIWQESAKNIEMQLNEIFKEYLNSYGLNIDNVKVTVKTDFTDFEIDKVLITGEDATSAKKLISGYFKIDNAYIFTE